MSTIITRVFEYEIQAAAAMTALHEAGFTADAVLLSRPAFDGANDLAAMRASLVAVGVNEATADACATRVAQGSRALTVQADFGSGRLATDIMEAEGGADLGFGDATTHRPDNAAPFSAIFGLPVLCNSPSPLSSWLNFNTLTPRQTGKAELMKNPAPFSDWAGVRTLSHTAAPLSSALGMPTLSRSPAPLSGATAMPTVVKGNWSFSGALGLPLLSSDPAPLSRLFGLPLLSANRSRRSG